jgi:hypothetical protein
MAKNSNSNRKGSSNGNASSKPTEAAKPAAAMTAASAKPAGATPAASAKPAVSTKSAPAAKALPEMAAAQRVDEKAPAARAPSAAEVSARAHQIWIARGKPTPGTPLEDWVQAERELTTRKS